MKEDQHTGVRIADGLYQVVTRAFVAGFVVERGIVVRCAPILRKKIDFWVRAGWAERIGD